MPKMTKYDLLIAGVMVAVLVAVMIALSPLEAPGAAANLYAAIGVIAVIFVAVEATIFIATKRGGHGALDTPVSDRAADGIKNTVSILWLLVCAMFMIMLISEHGKMFAAALVVPVVAAVIGGRRIQVKVRSTSLLPYSLTFILALSAAFAIERFGGWR